MNVKCLSLELAWIDCLTAFLATANKGAFLPDGAQPLDGAQSRELAVFHLDLEQTGQQDGTRSCVLHSFMSQLRCLLNCPLPQTALTADKCPFTRVASPEPISSRPIPMWYSQELVKDAVDNTVEMEVDHGYGEGKAI